MDIPSLEMFFDSDFILRVVSDGGGRLRYRWEIRQPAKWRAVEVSADRYATMEKAYAAGTSVLAAWQRGKRKIPEPAKVEREPSLIKPPSNMTNWRCPRYNQSS